MMTNAPYRRARWVQTHVCTYAIFRLKKVLAVNDSIRVQVHRPTGRYLDERERVEVMDG